jgi:hypothetical protein
LSFGTGTLGSQNTRETTPYHLLPPLSGPAVFPAEDIGAAVIGVARSLGAVGVFECGFEVGWGYGREAERVRGRGVLFGDGWAGVEEGSEGVQG